MNHRSSATPKLEDFAEAVSVVVSSCDAFFDAWQPFAFFFRKFWSDCPFPVFLILNQLAVRSSFIKPIHVGKDQGWARNMQIALGQITTPYILYFQEDYLLTGPVDRVQLADDFAVAFQENVASLCFADLSVLEPAFAETRNRFAPIPSDSSGRTRLQVALWKTSAFAASLVPGETAWEMEARGSARTRHLLQLSYASSAESPIPYLRSGIVRGLWTPEGIDLCRTHGVRIRPAFRPALTNGKWARRWRHALCKVGFALACAMQRDQPIDLDVA
ncbi:MAG: hypothetical protein M3Y69_07975 [Verrucomicrobiota bacterium]|nr:hypothetical protein [Verrucomicrobiota bacterium]